MKKLIFSIATALISCSAFAQNALDAATPDGLIKTIVTDVMASVKADPEIQKGNIPRVVELVEKKICLLYTSPSPRDQRGSRMPSSA